MTINISIIIPVYNAENTILQCLNSLANQSINQKYYEVICIDDGSLDNSFAILTAYNNIKNLITITQPNNGPARARNKGAVKARGNILLFTDSDCILDYYWIHEMTKPFEESDVVGVQGRYKTKQKQIISQFEQLEIENSYKKMSRIKYIDSIGTYSAAYRQEIFMKYGGFNTQYKEASGEDFELSYKIYNDGYQMVLNKNAICFHKHSEKLFDYLKTKYKRGYWRALLYKNIKNKIFSDTYTSFIMKSQFILVFFSILSLPVVLIDSIYLLFTLVCVLLFVILCIPFINFVGHKNIKVILISPFIIFLRAVFFMTGMIFGVIIILYKKFKLENVR